MKYRLVVSPAAEKFVLRLPPRDYAVVSRAVSALAEDPWPVQSLKLHGAELWRLRVGRYRVIYAADVKDRVIYVERVTRRSEKTYRGL